MVENKSITAADEQEAKRQPLKIVHTSATSSEAPYFVDMVKDHLLDKYSENDLLSQNYRVYTTLDPALQRAGAAAVEFGAKNVDDLLVKQYATCKRDKAKKRNKEPNPQLHIAPVSLYPRN